MRYSIIPVTPFQQNCTVLWCETTRSAALVDPGGEADRLLAALSKERLTLERILLTHGHLDHVGAAAEVAARTGVPIEGPHADEAFWLDMLPQQARMFGMPTATRLVPDRWLEEGDTVTVGGHALSVLHTPGHTPGHVVFFHADSKLALVGDVLFAGSIGRTDFPRGDLTTLLGSIRGKLWPLGDDVRFIPGHGPMSTIGAERRSNPFVAERGDHLY